MAMLSNNTQSPAELPAFKRQVLLYPFQWLGLALLLLIPLTALAGLFDRREQIVTASSDTLALEVEYQTHNRFKMPGFVAITVENRAATPLESVMVRISREYIDAFTAVAFAPDVLYIDDNVYVIELNNLEPGESRVVDMDYLGEKYGAHHGFVTVQADGVEAGEIEFDTFVFP